MSLRTDYSDDILDTSINTSRKYNFNKNTDGTYSIVDKTVYTQEGDYFGAADINATNTYVNELTGQILLDGYNSKKTTFNADGSITEVNITTGYSEITTFNSDGSITQQKYDQDSELLATMVTVFNEDGSITQDVTYVD